MTPKRCTTAYSIISRGAANCSDPTTHCGRFFTVYLKDALPGIAVCKLCEANDYFADAEVRFESSIHLRQRLDTNRNGNREALEKHEARGAGRKGGGSGVASSGKDAGSIIAYMDRVKPFTSKKLVPLIIDSLNIITVWNLQSSSSRVSCKVGRYINAKRITSRRDPRSFLLWKIITPLSR